MLRRGSNRAFFTCIGEGGGRGSRSPNLIGPLDHAPPLSRGGLSFLGFRSSPPKIDPYTVPQKRPTLKAYGCLAHGTEVRLTAALP
jgi:hypothetical protein